MLIAVFAELVFDNKRVAVLVYLGTCDGKLHGVAFDLPFTAVAAVVKNVAYDELAAALKIVARKKLAVIPECTEVGNRRFAGLQIVVAHKAVVIGVKANAEKILIQGLDLRLLCADGAFNDRAVMRFDGVGVFFSVVVTQHCYLIALAL